MITGRFIQEHRKTNSVIRVQCNHEHNSKEGMRTCICLNLVCSEYSALVPELKTK